VSLFRRGRTRTYHHCPWELEDGPSVLEGVRYLMPEKEIILLLEYHGITGESRIQLVCVHGEFQLPMILERDIKSISRVKMKRERATQP
jgi:hypothetical protein